MLRLVGEVVVGMLDGVEGGRESSMILDDVYDDVFGVLVHWLYHQKVDSISFMITCKDGTQRINLTRLGELWILADRFLMPELQNATMDELVRIDLSSKISCNFHRLVGVAYGFQDGKNVLATFTCKSLAYSRKSLPQKYRSEIPVAMLIDVINELKHAAGMTPEMSKQRFDELSKPGLFHIKIGPKPQPRA